MEWILVDRQPSLVRAWSRVFAGTPVHVKQEDFVTAAVGAAWVSPANSFGWMNGGLDWVIAYAYTQAGCDITKKVQEALYHAVRGELPVGQALVVPTPDTPYSHLIVAPTMRTPRPVRWTVNAYLAFRAALLAVEAHNAAHPDDAITRVCCPGLGTGVGRMPAARCARQMRAAWDAVQQPVQPMPHLGALTVREIHWRHG